MNPPVEKICIVCHRSFPSHLQECPEDRVRLSEKDSRIGTIFDNKYEILDFIGAGGLSRVYKARHIELNRIMALKVLKSSELIDLQRFRREAISIGQLDHPNIARVFSFAVAPNGCPYMALEFMDGRDLAEFIAREGPLNLEQALSLFEQVASALEHAHSRSIIHRDIKPGNIVLRSSPEQAESVKVVDFGMAKFQLEGGMLSQKLTQEGEVFGTRQYISPEQYRGVVADARADIYSLGVTMYEAVLKDGKIPEPLSQVISKATETDPTARFQTARELKDELARIRQKVRLQDSGSQLYVNAEKRSASSDWFGTLYFRSMIAGLLVFAVTGIFMVRQRMQALESMAKGANKSSRGRVVALSLAATKTQADNLRNRGQVKEAIKLYQDWFLHHKNSDRWSSSCVAYKDLANLYLRAGDPSSAAKSARDGIVIAERHGMKTGYEYEDLLVELAEVIKLQGNYKESMAISAQVIEATEDLDFTHDIENRLIAFHNIADCQNRLHQYEAAELTAREALELASKAFGPESTSCGDHYLMLAYIYNGKLQYAKAIESLGKAKRCFQGHPGSLSNYIFVSAFKAELEIRAGRQKAARDDFELVLAELKKHHLPGELIADPGVYASMSRVARALGRTAELERLKH